MAGVVRWGECRDDVRHGCERSAAPGDIAGDGCSDTDCDRLVGNLATSTVQVKAGWWVPLTWTATGLLVLAALVGQIAQSRAGDGGGQDDGRALTTVPA